MKEKNQKIIKPEKKEKNTTQKTNLTNKKKYTFNDNQLDESYGKLSLAKDWIRKSKIQSLLRAKKSIYNKKKKNSIDLTNTEVNHNEKFKNDIVLTLKDSKILGRDHQNMLENKKILDEELGISDCSDRKDKNVMDPKSDALNRSLIKYDIEYKMPSRTGFKLSEIEIKETFLKRISVKKKLEQAEKFQLNNNLNIEYNLQIDLTKQNKLYNFRKRKKKIIKKHRRIKEIGFIEEYGKNHRTKNTMNNTNNELKKKYSNLKFLKSKMHVGESDKEHNYNKEFSKKHSRYMEALKDSEMNTFLLENESDNDLDLQTNLRLTNILTESKNNKEDDSIVSVINRSIKERKKLKEIELNTNKQISQQVNSFTFSTASHFAQSLKDIHSDNEEDFLNVAVDKEEEWKNDFKMDIKSKRLKALNSNIDVSAPIVAKGLSQTMKYVKNRGFDKDADFEQFVGIKQYRSRPIDVTIKRNLPFINWTNEQVVFWAKKNEMKKFYKILKEKKVKGIDMQATKSVMRNVWGFNENDISLYRSKLGKLTGDSCPDIQLPYIGTDGRPMTMDDAFRTMSHIFHGKKPGKKNTEKRLRMHQVERERKSSLSLSDTPLGVMSRISEVMSIDNRPFIIMEGNTDKRFAKNVDYTDEHFDKRHREH